MNRYPGLRPRYSFIHGVRKNKNSHSGALDEHQSGPERPIFIFMRGKNKNIQTPFSAPILAKMYRKRKENKGFP